MTWPFSSSSLTAVFAVHLEAPCLSSVGSTLSPCPSPRQPWQGEGHSWVVEVVVPWTGRPEGEHGSLGHFSVSSLVWRTTLLILFLEAH